MLVTPVLNALSELPLLARPQWSAESPAILIL